VLSTLSLRHFLTLPTVCQSLLRNISILFFHALWRARVHERAGTWLPACNIQTRLQQAEASSNNNSHRRVVCVKVFLVLLLGYEISD